MSRSCKNNLQPWEVEVLRLLDCRSHRPECPVKCCGASSLHGNKSYYGGDLGVGGLYLETSQFARCSREHHGGLEAGCGW